MFHKHNLNNSSTISELSSSSSSTENSIISVPSIKSPKVLFIEPFYGGSHKQLIDVLMANIQDSTLVTLSAKKWHWRARCSPLIIYKSIPAITSETTLFCSSVLNLCELLGLRQDLYKLRKILYFHENQLVYPIREIKERDVQYAYNQIISCLAADVVIFNSHFNKDSFLNNISSVMKLLPDNRPKNLKEEIEKNSLVLYFPIDLPRNLVNLYDKLLHIVWPHRWEFDKNPESFIQVVLKLKENGLKFRVSMLGQGYKDVPDIFKKAKDGLHDEIHHFGFIESKSDYLNVLSKSHVAVSTAKHEFFGVSMIEAVSCGCFPLVPNKLVYKEIYPKECLYNDDIDLYKRLEYFCKQPDESITNRKNLNINLEEYSIEHLLPKYLEYLL